MQQLLLTLTMLISEGVTLSEEQIMSIQRILWGAMDPTITLSPIARQSITPGTSTPELVYGLAGMAKLMGTSIPTVSRYRERFEPARVHFGGRRLVWDKAKVIEIAKNSKW